MPRRLCRRQVLVHVNRLLLLLHVVGEYNKAPLPVLLGSCICEKYAASEILKIREHSRGKRFQIPLYFHDVRRTNDAFSNQVLCSADERRTVARANAGILVVFSKSGLTEERSGAHARASRPTNHLSAHLPSNPVHKCSSPWSGATTCDCHERTFCQHKRVS